MRESCIEKHLLIRMCQLVQLIDDKEHCIQVQGSFAFYLLVLKNIFIKFPSKRNTSGIYQQ